VSLGADLLSIYDDARRNLDDVATYNADGDYVEMLAAEEHGVSSASRSRTVVSTPATPDRPSASAAAAVQRGSSDVDERTCKRPLSVSSTSSSMSSTSSFLLPTPTTEEMCDEWSLMSDNKSEGGETATGNVQCVLIATVLSLGRIAVLHA